MEPAASSAVPKAPPVCIVTCGILGDEVRTILRRNGLSLPVYSLAPAPCLDHRSLRRQLSRVLQRAREKCPRVLVVIGQCHPDIDELLSAPAGVKRLPIDNCIAALLGRTYRRLRTEKPTFFTTPTWLKHWRRAMKRAGWDEVGTRQNLGFNERVLVLDTGVTSYTPEEALEFFDFAQVPLEFLSVGLDELEEVLLRALGLSRPSRQQKDT